MKQIMTCLIFNAKTVPRAELARLWIDIEPKHKTVFNDLDVITFSDFLNLVLSSDNHFFYIMESHNPVAFMWLNGWEGYAARCHYVFFKAYYGRSVEICRDIVARIFEMKRLDGTPLVKTMVGLTPITNRLAVRMIERVGFIKAAEIPDAVWLAAENRSVTGIISYRSIDNG